MLNRLRGVIRILAKNSSLSIILLDLLIQIALIGKYLDNSVISPYAPTASDAADYTTRAEKWQIEGFSEAFNDAYRMPGYPFLIYLLRMIAPAYPYLGVRLFQMLAVAISVGLLKIILEKYVSFRIAIIGSLIYAILPIWHFVPVLLAESLTSVVIVSLLFVLSSFSFSKIKIKEIVYVSALIACGTYLKPNNLLLIIPTIVFLIFYLKSMRKILVLIPIFVLTFLSPWIFFANSVQPGFIGLTTNSGGNFYTGTGMVLSYDNSVLAKSAIKWKVDPRNNSSDIIVFGHNQTILEQNSIQLEKSLTIWKNRPIQEFGYSIDKILIAFGVKANSKIDKIFGLISILTLLVAIALLRLEKFRAWGASTLATAFLLAMQAAIFQADRRFIVPVLLPFSILCICSLSEHFRNMPHKI